MDWLLYDRDLRHERVNLKLAIYHLSVLVTKCFIVGTRAQNTFQRLPFLLHTELKGSHAENDPHHRRALGIC